MSTRLLVLGAFLAGVLIGAGVAVGVLWWQLSSSRADVASLADEVEQLKAATRVVAAIEPGAGDNAPTEWTGQTGRIRYRQVSTIGFEYNVEAENLPPDRIFHVFFSTGAPNTPRVSKKAGELKTDFHGRGTLSGVVPLPPGVYAVGNSMFLEDDPNPPYTHRTWLCWRQAVSIEVSPKKS